MLTKNEAKCDDGNSFHENCVRVCFCCQATFLKLNEVFHFLSLRFGITSWNGVAGQKKSNEEINFYDNIILTQLLLFHGFFSACSSFFFLPFFSFFVFVLLLLCAAAASTTGEQCEWWENAKRVLMLLLASVTSPATDEWQRPTIGRLLERNKCIKWILDVLFYSYKWKYNFLGRFFFLLFWTTNNCPRFYG